MFDVGDHDLPVPTSGNWLIKCCMTKWLRFLRFYDFFWKFKKHDFWRFLRFCARFLERWVLSSSACFVLFFFFLRPMGSQRPLVSCTVRARRIICCQSDRFCADVLRSCTHAQLTPILVFLDISNHSLAGACFTRGGRRLVYLMFLCKLLIMSTFIHQAGRNNTERKYKKHTHINSKYTI